MLNLKIKSEKGFTLATLVITVILLIIITVIMARQSYTSMAISKLSKLQNDIEQLNDRIAAYYVKNDKLPVDTSNPINKPELYGVLNDMSSKDGNTYYKLELNMLDNLSLNYGKNSADGDYYLINEESHVVYYYAGIEYDGEEYHTVGENTGTAE